MKQVFERYPWLYRALCAVMTGVLLFNLSMPLLGMHAAEPDNPIPDTETQEITVLQAGRGEGLSGDGETGTADGSGQGGGDSLLEGEQEQQEPDSQQESQGQQNQTQERPQDTPKQEYLAEATIGTSLDSNQGSEGEEAGSTGEQDDTLTESDLSLGAVLTWYKFGKQAQSMVCAPGESVGKRVLLVQLDDGQLPYDIELTGLDADDAEITGVTFAPGNGVAQELPRRGAVELLLPDGAEYRNYFFTVALHVTHENGQGETQELDTECTFVLRLESGIDLDLQLTWRPDGQATCAADSSLSRTIHSDELEEGRFQYALTLLGECAEDAALVTAEYWTTDGERGELHESGEIQMAPADGQDTEVYYLSVTVQALGQTLSYTFVLTYEDSIDLQLRFTWYEKGVTARENLCDANERIGFTVKHNQVSGNELLYDMGLTGDSADEAQLLSAVCGGTSLNAGSGSLRLDPSTAATYTIVVTAQVQEQTVTFTVSIRYQSDVSLEMAYTIINEGAATDCLLTCENKKSVTAEPIYTDQLTDGLLHYTLRIRGEESSDVTITSVRCYQSGSFRTLELSASGSVTLLPKGDQIGDNTFTVTASGADGESYSFTLNLPFKPRGENKVQIVTNLSDGQEITNGQVVNLTVKAWSEDAAGNVISYIQNSNSRTTLTVTLDGAPCRYHSASGYTQEYLLEPKNPEEGDTLEHTLHIVAEDEGGNRGELTLTLLGKRTEEGQKIGTASIYIDMSVLGLGIYGPVSYDVLSKEPISYSVAKAIWGYDAGETFGTAENSLHWPQDRCTYSGALDQGFYLESLDNGSGLGSQADALSGAWVQFGSTEEEILAGIDAHFAADPYKAALWRCIYRNGIELSSVSTGVGEFDFTMGSGWLYALGGTYYPGSSMSTQYLKDGDVLTLRYTLAFGWDVGSGQDSYGSPMGYCVSCINGQWSLNHRYTEITTEDGLTRYVCSCCGTVQACPHEQTVWGDLEDGTCAEKCQSCGEVLGTPQEHELTCEDGGDTHTATCTRCGYTEQGEHSWKELSNTATCLDGGILTKQCQICQAQREEESPATGHQPQNVWMVDETLHQHYQQCLVCGERIEDSAAVHTYIPLDGDWQCSVCGQIHGFICFGALIPDESRSTCRHLIGTCSDCGLPLEQDGSFPEYHSYVEGVCSICGEPDPDYIKPEDPDPLPDPEPDPGLEPEE